MNAELPICEATLGWVYGCSRRGATHLQDNLPCQDAYGIATGSVVGSPHIAVAVADGHGDPAHDLSHFGAALAVKAAIDELQSFLAHFGSPQTVHSLSKTFLKDFQRRVSRRWRDRVGEDAKDRLSDVPLSPDDKQQLWTRYGTTLLVALIVQDIMLVGQIGDGDIFFLRADGNVESPIKKDPSLVGKTTYSLCSPDATQLWQTAIVRQEGGGMLLLATDGLLDAFPGEDQVQLQHFHTFARTLVERVNKYGIESVATSIPKWLDEKYSKASGDDIALALVNVRGSEVGHSTDSQQTQETQNPHSSELEATGDS